ncbi:MAG: hypothetical protein GY771_01285 [bacterium]|nr:hypothetical protein [bacterium]
MGELEKYKDNLEGLEKIMGCFNVQLDIIGRGTGGVLYQAGKDVGITDGKCRDRTDDIVTAVDLIKRASRDVWNVEVWTDADKDDVVFKEEEYNKIHAIFRECPIRQVCISQGIEMDGGMCKLAYGYYAGLLSSILEKKVNLKTIEAGPNSCKYEIFWRED